MASKAARFDLFHRIADPSSAQVRRFVSDHGLDESVRFRNVAFSESEQKLTFRGGSSVPALWDGDRLHVGAEACIARLKAHFDVGRSG